jgi:hypothetical protein
VAIFILYGFSWLLISFYFARNSIELWKVLHFQVDSELVDWLVICFCQHWFKVKHHSFIHYLKRTIRVIMSASKQWKMTRTKIDFELTKTSHLGTNKQSFWFVYGNFVYWHRECVGVEWTSRQQLFSISLTKQVLSFANKPCNFSLFASCALCKCGKFALCIENEKLECIQNIRWNWGEIPEFSEFIFRFLASTRSDRNIMRLFKTLDDLLEFAGFVGKSKGWRLHALLFNSKLIPTAFK